MKQVWYLALAVSIGLNLGLIYMTLSDRTEGQGEEDRRERTVSIDSETGRPKPLGESPVDREAVIRSHLDRLVQDLQLTKKQRTSINAIHEHLLPRILKQRKEMDLLREAVASLYAQSTIAGSEFRDVVRKISTAQAELDSLVTEAILGEAFILTFEQRQRYLHEMPWGHPMPPPDGPHDDRQDQPPRRDDETSQPKPPRRDDDNSRPKPPRQDGDTPPPRGK